MNYKIPARTQNLALYPQLLLLWISWFTLASLGGLFGLSDFGEHYGLYLIAAHSMLALAVLLSRPSKFLAVSLVLSYMIRIALMLTDIYVQGFALPGSGGDTEGYYRSATEINADPSRFNGYIYGGIYSKFLGALVIIGGPSREVLQYTNVLASISIVLIVSATARELRLSQAAERGAIALTAFLPYFLVTSAILLRETAITLLLAVSFHLVCRWVIQGGTPKILAGLGFAALATSLHSGVIVYMLAYLLAIILYDRQLGRLRFTARNFSVSFFVLAAFLGAIALAPEVFLNQFESLEESGGLLETANHRAGGAAYLTGLTAETSAQILLYSPLRAFYFLASPLPWDWRSALDALTFILDSSIYTSITALVAREVFRQRRQLPPVLVLIAVILMGGALLFGIGVSNSGTAVRHRTKLVPVLSIALAMIIHRRRKDRTTTGHGATNS